jgi:AcrR family transcriptional regulator
MPRYVDHDDRRSQIIKATLDVLAEDGPSGLNFRTVSARMGGSSTIVTHYFASKQELLDALVENLARWPAEVAELEEGARDPRDRLRLFLRWLLPCDEQGLLEETARINLIGERDTRVRTEHLFAAWDQNVRSMLTRHVEELVPARRVSTVVDVLRSATNGITLSTVEHPDEWPADRQFGVLDEILAAFGLLPTSSRKRAREKAMSR